MWPMLNGEAASAAASRSSAFQHGLLLGGVGGEMHVGGMRALALVAQQQQEVEEAVAERLPPQRGHALLQIGRIKLRPLRAGRRDIRIPPASCRARCRRRARASGFSRADSPPSATGAAWWSRPPCARSRGDRRGRARARRSSPCARRANAGTSAASWRIPVGHGPISQYPGRMIYPTELLNTG